MFGFGTNNSEFRFGRSFLICILGTLPIYAILSHLTGEIVYVLVASIAIPASIITAGYYLAKKCPLVETNFVTKQVLIDDLQSSLSTPSRTHNAACVVMEIDTECLNGDVWDRATTSDVSSQFAERLASSLRGDDSICQLAEGKFAIALPMVRLPDLGAILSVITRLQTAVSDPMIVDGKTRRITMSAGFCLETRAPARTGKALLDAALAALEDSKRHAPAATRGFSAATPKVSTEVTEPLKEFLEALRDGEIVPWFQPQVSGDTGKVIGFEALARWERKDKGSFLPRDFLPALEQAGRLEELSEIIMNHSLKALKAWDRAGYDVPTVSVNFAAQELRNPNLVERIKWDVDRFSLQPDRLTIEILETVMASTEDDIIARNIRALGAEGFKIDLDDFGTGQASLAHIRRFNVDRVKIDRSFVAHIDEDPDQQKMVAAVIALAEQLGIETLAEGVETLGEKSILSQLGCDAMQGYSVGRPLPFDETLAWLDEHDAKLRLTPGIIKRVG